MHPLNFQETKPRKDVFEPWQRLKSRSDNVALCSRNRRLFGRPFSAGRSPYSTLPVTFFSSSTLAVIIGTWIDAFLCCLVRLQGVN
jgi:hypothetical protein